MTIRLEKLTLVHEEQVLAYKDDFLKNGENLAGGGSLVSAPDYMSWLEVVRKDESSETCPKDKVPATLFLAIRNEDERVVGMIQLRHHIDHPILSTWGGHIGYSVSPSERRKGYAKEMLRLCVLEAKKLGIKQVLVTCSNKNTASEKTIVANNGIFEYDVLHEGTIYKRYWIQCE